MCSTRGFRCWWGDFHRLSKMMVQLCVKNEVRMCSLLFFDYIASEMLHSQIAIPLVGSCIDGREIWSALEFELNEGYILQSIY